MKPRICAAIVNNDLAAIREVEAFVEMFELRIDLVGVGWPDVAKELKKPWIACVRSRSEGGQWQGEEDKRTETLLSAVSTGAAIVDIELRSNTAEKIIKLIKQKARCLVSLHYVNNTPRLDEMKEIVREQMACGADICKVVTTAQDFADNLITLELITAFPGTDIVSFAMGPAGATSRVLCPLVGGCFTYASISDGNESAPGQLTIGQLRKIYEMMRVR